MGSSPVWGAQATLVADVELRGAAPSTNDGSLAYLDVGNSSLTLLQFDLSLLPAGVTPANVSRAVLQLYVDSVTTPGSVQITPVLGAWGEYTVTYNTQPPLGSPSAELSVSQPGAFVAVDVTSLVQGWLSNPSGNFGMALSAESAVAQFNSKENEQTSHAPILDVDLIDPGAPGPQGLPGPQGPAGLTGPAGLPTGIQIGGSPSYPGLLWATSPTAGTLATPQTIAGSLIDVSGTSMYLSSANPTAPGPNNIVMGVGAGSHLAFGAGYGGEDSVIIGHDAAHNATSAREDVVIGYQAGYGLTGCCSGSSAEDSVVVLIGSLAGAAINNNGTDGTIDTVMIGQKAGLNDANSGEDVMIGNHVGTGISASNSDTLVGYNAWATTNNITSYYDTIIGNNAGGHFPNGYASLFNTGVGYNVFSSMGLTGSGGQYNTAIGGLAGANITSGMFNTCIGIQTCGVASPGEGVMTGVRNVYLNTQQIASTTASDNFVAMDGNTLTTGDANVIISELAQVKTGSGNVCLGIYACRYVNGTEGNIVAVGFAADVAPGVSNAVELGNGSNSQPYTLAFDGFSFLNTSGMFTEALTTPASSSAPCTAGQFTDDANYHYVCTAPNTWKRVALSSF